MDLSSAGDPPDRGPSSARGPPLLFLWPGDGPSLLFVGPGSGPSVLAAAAGRAPSAGEEANHGIAMGMLALPAPPAGSLAEPLPGSGTAVGSPSVVQPAETEDESLLELSRQYSGDGRDP